MISSEGEQWGRYNLPRYIYTILYYTWLLYWLVVEPYPSEKYEFVTWDDDIPNIWKIIQMFQTTNQYSL